MTTKDELYERATELEIDGRSTMDKDELEAAIAEHEGSSEQGEQPTAGDHDGDGVTTTAPMDDPVGTAVDHREELAEETGASEPLPFEETTHHLNSELASTGDPEVTWEQVKANRSNPGLGIKSHEDVRGEHNAKLREDAAKEDDAK